MKAKICGITNAFDYNAVNKLGCDYTGFIFYKKSPRYIKPEKAVEIDIPDRTSLRVGVFVNEKADTVRNIFHMAKLDYVQLHGDETPEYCDKLGLPYIRAFRVKDSNCIKLFAAFNTEYILIDTYVKGSYGGTGKSINLELMREIINLGKDMDKKIIAAGGIDPDNIQNILELNPYAVDVNSGIEKSPGKKDPVKMENIFKVIRKFNRGM